MIRKLIGFVFGIHFHDWDSWKDEGHPCAIHAMQYRRCLDCGATQKRYV